MTTPVTRASAELRDHEVEVRALLAGLQRDRGRAAFVGGAREKRRRPHERGRLRRRLEAAIRRVPAAASSAHASSCAGRRARLERDVRAEAAGHQDVVAGRQAINAEIAVRVGHGRADRTGALPSPTFAVQQVELRGLEVGVTALARQLRSSVARRSRRRASARLPRDELLTRSQWNRRRRHARPRLAVVGRDVARPSPRSAGRCQRKIAEGVLPTIVGVREPDVGAVDPRQRQGRASDRTACGIGRDDGAANRRRPGGNRSRRRIARR